MSMEKHPSRKRYLKEMNDALLGTESFTSTKIIDGHVEGYAELKAKMRRGT